MDQLCHRLRPMGIPCQRLVNDSPVNSHSPTRYRFLIPLDTRLVRERLLTIFLTDTYDHEHALHLGASMDLFYPIWVSSGPGFWCVLPYKHSLGASLSGSFWTTSKERSPITTLIFMYSSISCPFTWAFKWFINTVLSFYLPRDTPKVFFMTKFQNKKNGFIISALQTFHLFSWLRQTC